ncbi:unnamed protein product, partial [Didymodactylos carnosus]
SAEIVLWSSAIFDNNIFTDEIGDNLSPFPALVQSSNSLGEIRKLFVGNLLKIREGHVLPGTVMKTVTSSYTYFLESFVDGLLPKLNLPRTDHTCRRYLNQIEDILSDVSKNEESFMAACEEYFGLIKPVEVALPTGAKAYYV